MDLTVVHNYPRPDFVRNGLRWQSLDGLWNFLFDDEDVGLLKQWHRKGLPESTTVSAQAAAADLSEAEKITQRIASGTQDLLKGNLFEKETGSKTQEKRQIIVPFVYQTPASGIDERGAHEVLWYERNVSGLPNPEAEMDSYRFVLRFGAVDYEATVWVDGQYVGEHQGGHVPFDLDITDALSAKSTSARLTIRVRDSTYDLTQPRGKQYWAAQPESIFYTASSGIWQSVWLETVPATRLADSSHGTILRSNDIESGQLHAEIAVQGRRSGQGLQVEIEATFAGVTLSSQTKALPREVDTVSLDLDVRLSDDQQRSLPDRVQQSIPSNNDHCWYKGLAVWSPDHPSLYDITIRLFDTNTSKILDEITTTTGMRSLSWTNKDSTFRLNNRPLFQKLCLDQAYWPDTGLTGPSPSHLEKDILLAKGMGFNGCRLHQRTADPIFLHHADKLGYLVWGEMANAYNFSSTYSTRFTSEWRAAVLRDRNHPSVIAWTPVNESWAYTDLANNVQQRNHIRELYYVTKGLDPTRPVNDNCGWEHVCDDLSTFHDYSDGEKLTETCSSMQGILGLKAGGRPMFCQPIIGEDGRIIDAGASHRAGAPVICTEMGGVNIAPVGKEKGRDWGYTTATDAEDLVKRVEKLVMGVVEGGLVCGFVWTQLADIEQETNGLYDCHRKEKLDSGKVREIFERAEKLYSELFAKRQSSG